MMLGSESRRRAFLAALDIPVWLARAPLPGASPSFLADDLHQDTDMADEAPDLPVDGAEPEPRIPLADIPPKDDGVPGESAIEGGPLDEGPPLEAYLADPDIAEAAIAGPRSSKGLLRGLQTEPIKEAQPSQVAVRVAGAVGRDDDMQPVHFQFAVFATAPWRLVIPRLSLLSPSEHRLLLNILTAMRAAENPTPFVWPMLNNPAVPRHRAAALEALTPFLNRQGKDARGWIILGEHEQELIRLLQAGSTRPVVTCAGLSMLLQQPALKRALWQALNA